ncbi:MAG: hypothetical protein ACOC8B_04665 [Gemmatimonadota bacterium]
MKRTITVACRGIIGVVATAAAFGVAGCDDPFEDRANVEGAATLYSLSRDAHLFRPSALSLLPGASLGTVIVEEINNPGWDVALAEEDGGFLLLPAGAVQAQGRAAIYMDTLHTFEERTEAPGDADVYNDSASVPLRTDAVYVVRTRNVPGCDAYFAKLRASEIDDAQGSVRFEYILNPNCAGTDLEPPPEDDDEDEDGGDG